jgi:hypothetical protein
MRGLIVNDISTVRNSINNQWWRNFTAPIFLFCLACGGLLFFTSNIFCQEVTATITGIVTDPTGAPIAGATVTATDMDRGTTLPTTTNADGLYNLPRVPVGRYEIRVEMHGFETAVRSSVVLQLNQTAKVDLKLNLAGC